MLVEKGVHYYQDGHFWMEVPGLPDSEDEDEDYPIPVKKNTKVTFSSGPIKVSSWLVFGDCLDLCCSCRHVYLIFLFFVDVQHFFYDGL